MLYNFSALFILTEHCIILANMAIRRKFPLASKYGAIRMTYNGQTYASKKEAIYAQELDLRVRAGDLASWERQIPFDLVVEGVKVCRYVIDFLEIDKHGNKVYCEVKGFPTPEWKLKRKLFEALYPKLNYKVVT